MSEQDALVSISCSGCVDREKRGGGGRWQGMGPGRVGTKRRASRTDKVRARIRAGRARSGTDPVSGTKSQAPGSWQGCPSLFDRPH